MSASLTVVRIGLITVIRAEKFERILGYHLIRCMRGKIFCRKGMGRRFLFKGVIFIYCRRHIGYG